MIPYGSLVIYMTPKGKRYLKRLTEDEDWHSKDGILFSRDIAQADFGDTVMTSMGKPIQVMEATLQDRLKGVKRQTQIIYPRISPISACGSGQAQAESYARQAADPEP